MQDDFHSLFAFNRWANNKMLQACQQITPEQYSLEPVPGWTPIRATVYHICLVTEGWSRGLVNDLNQDFPAEEDLGTPLLAQEFLQLTYARLDQLLNRLTPEWLSTPVTLQRRNRKATLPPWAVLRHIVNHTTYHRSQVASKLKRFGVQQPETDFVYWVYEQIPQG